MATTNAGHVEQVQSSALFNRWLIPVAAVAVHICIGSVYAWSTFNRPIHAEFPTSPWWFSPPFPDRRGMATGFAIMGFGGGAFLAGYLNPYLMARVSVSETLMLLGVAYFIIKLNRFRLRSCGVLVELQKVGLR